jgi:hypothetical protein
MQIVIPIALLFLLWRRWRFFAGFALSTCLLSLISLWVVGFAQTAAYARSLLSVGTNMPAALQFPLRVSIMANLRGLFFGLLGDRLPAFWIQVLTIVTSVPVLLWVAFAIRGKQRGAGAFVLAITASLIVSYYLFIHDLSVLLIPIVVTLDRFILAGAERPATTLDRASGWMSAALLVAPMCIFLIPDHFYLVALPLCAFMVILIRGFPREPQALSSERYG